MLWSEKIMCIGCFLLFIRLILSCQFGALKGVVLIKGCFQKVVFVEILEFVVFKGVVFKRSSRGSRGLPGFAGFK